MSKNLLFLVEVRGLDPVIAADKVREAVDIRLVCYDRLDKECNHNYISHCERIQSEVDEAVENES